MTRASRWTLHWLSAGYAASLAPAWRRFASAASDPERTQGRKLKDLLSSNKGTVFGREPFALGSNPRAATAFVGVRCCR